MFGEKLKILRRKRGLTQAQLADILNISPSAVGMYEQGRREPDNNMLAKICVLLNTSTDFLLGLENRENDSDIEVNDFIDEFTASLRAYPGLMFNGFPVSSEDREKIVRAIKVATAVAVYDTNNIKEI